MPREKRNITPDSPRKGLAKGRRKDAPGQGTLNAKPKIPETVGALNEEIQKTNAKVKLLRRTLLTAKGEKDAASAKCKETKAALEDNHEHLEACVEALGQKQGDLALKD